MSRIPSVFARLAAEGRKALIPFIAAGDPDPALTLPLMRALVAHHFAGQSEEQVAASAAQMAQKRIVVVVHADKTISWDHRKLGGVY